MRWRPAGVKVVLVEKGAARERRLGAVERPRAHALHQRMGRAAGVGELSRVQALDRAHGRPRRLHPHGLRERGGAAVRGQSPAQCRDAARASASTRRRSPPRSSRSFSPSPTWTTSARRPTSRTAATPIPRRRWRASAGAPTELGARVLQWTAVTRVIRQESRVIGVETSAGRIDAGSVIVAAGAWSRRLCTEFGLDLPARPKAIDTVAVTRPPELGKGHMVFIDNVQGNYFRPEGGGLTLVGVPCQEWDIDPDTLGTGLLAAGGRHGRPAPHASHPGHGAGHARARLPGLRRLQRRPSRDSRARGRHRRPLPRHGVQRLRVQDRAGRRHVHGRAGDWRGAPRPSTSSRSVSGASPRGAPSRGPIPTRCGRTTSIPSRPAWHDGSSSGS